MAKIKCLYFEDEDIESRTIRRNLSIAWETVAKENLAFAETGEPVESIEFVHFVDDEESATELSERGDRYHLLLLDLLIEDHETGHQRNVGVSLANVARGKKYRMGIIGVSSVEQSKSRGARIDFEREAKLPIPGSHGTFGRSFIQKADLFDPDHNRLLPTEVGKILRDVLIDATVLVEKDLVALKEKKESNKGIRLFISHSHQDEELAKRMVDLLDKALKIDTDEVRCTSVPGYDLSGGDPSAEVLKKNLQDCDVVIGLITPKSLSSSFVLFELGAAWGLGKRLIPFLGPDFDPGIMRAPLRDFHAYKWRTRTDWEKLIDDLSGRLKIEKKNAVAYSTTLDEIVKI